ncbi:MAG: type II CRISPR-associated endonuclease Cas1 [Thermoguttaceae bacterium]|nr:type II CRISPR-associated endonuclease Cas1 [Thermoguttaceae bacterium]
MNRIIDFTDQTKSVSIKNRQLIIEEVDGKRHSIPTEEVAAAIFSGYCINITKSVIELLSECGASIIVCDKSKMPVGMMVPISGHHLQSRFVKEQAEATLPTLKRLWKQIVSAKIKGQAQNLLAIYQEDFALGKMAALVKLGDETNIEGRAARRYWSKLFRVPKFTRDCDGEDVINSSLNYGYAILRSLVARAIVSSGLNPSLGLFHHNKYNAFCLADDLMEPYRPVVDNIVWHLYDSDQLSEGITTGVKRALIEAISSRYIISDRQETIFEAATRTTSSLVSVFCGQKKELCLPKRLPLIAREITEATADAH